MWICLNNAFVSAVEHNDDPTLLVVRARVSGHLEAFFAGTIPAVQLKIEVNPERDYLYRTVVGRHAFADALAHHAINSIDYGNFKDSVENPALHHAYSRVWGTMLSLQARGKYVEPLERWQYVEPERWHGLPAPVIEPKVGKIKTAKKRVGGKKAKVRPLPDADFASFGDTTKPAKKKGKRK